MADYWLNENKHLNEKLTEVSWEGPYQYRIKQELARHGKEYLLKYLSAKCFLPGYGFPTDVVTFDNKNVQDYKRLQKTKKEREDNISRLKALPSRNLSIAIREYAPGAEIVIDGRVFKSAGIALNWQQIGRPNAHEAQKLSIAWRCNNCGHAGIIENTTINDQYECTNCNAKIRLEHKKQYLEPTGFATEFYAIPSNDITYQKFIPVQKPWIFIKGKRKVNLPNPSCGFMKYSHEGHIFYHSSGENEHGYAICLSCGRVESMLSNGELPKNFQLNKSHSPLRGHAKNKEKLPCDASIQENMHLGCVSQTDVLELYLRNPINHEFIPSYNKKDETGKIIAYTLAVAIRDALAEKLGISTTEMGYAVRPDKSLTTHHKRTVIQIFDQNSGGSGFATSAPVMINNVLKTAFKKLDCPECDTACSHCLLSADTRFDVQYLNRKIALAWLSNDFNKQLSLPNKFHHFQFDNHYCHLSLKEKLRHIINQGVKQITFWLSDNSETWDLTALKFIDTLYEYLLVDKIAIRLVLPNQNLAQEIKQRLQKLNQLGIQLITSPFSIRNGYAIVQCELIDEKIITFATSNNTIITPSQFWLSSIENESTLVYSLKTPLVKTKHIKTDMWKLQSQTNANVISIKRELNGKLNEFGQRFWLFLCRKNNEINELFKKDKLININYTDRYLQSPWYILLITELLKIITKNSHAKVKINTYFNNNKSIGNKLVHDWNDQNDHEQLFMNWCKYNSIDLTLNYVDTIHNIQHSRVIILKWKSNKKSTITFDQGMGYWKPKYDRSIHFFNFNPTLKNQAISLKTSYNKARLENSSKWKTDITIINNKM